MTDRSLYTADMAERLKARAGQKWRPSNGTEGDMFEDRWCRYCAHMEAFRQAPAAQEACSILGAAYCFDVGDKEYPAAWQYGPDGQPRCSEFQDKNAPAPCPRTIDLFGGA